MQWKNLCYLFKFTLASNFFQSLNISYPFIFTFSSHQYFVVNVSESTTILIFHTLCHEPCGVWKLVLFLTTWLWWKQGNVQCCAFTCLVVHTVYAFVCSPWYNITWKASPLSMLCRLIVHTVKVCYGNLSTVETTWRHNWSMRPTESLWCELWL